MPAPRAGRSSSVASRLPRIRRPLAAFAALVAAAAVGCDFGIDTTGLSGGDAQPPADAADESAPADASQEAAPPVDAGDESAVADAGSDAANDAASD